MGTQHLSTIAPVLSINPPDTPSRSGILSDGADKEIMEGTSCERRCASAKNTVVGTKFKQQQQQHSSSSRFLSALIVLIVLPIVAGVAIIVEVLSLPALRSPQK